MNKKAMIRIGSGKRNWHKVNEEPVGLGRAVVIRNEEEHQGREAHIVRVGKEPFANYETPLYDICDVFVRAKK